MPNVSTVREQLVAENSVLYDAALPFYDPESEHHSMEGHILDAWEDARIITGKCLDTGHEIDIMVVDADVLFHDADWHKPLKSHGFKTKERRSASIARKTIPNLDLGYTSSQIQQISEDIISTTQGLTPTTKEGAILWRADMNNLGFSTPEFLRVSVRVARELLRVSRLPVDQDAVRCWLEKTPGFLEELVRDEPDIPGFDLSEILEENIPFRERARANIEHLGNISVTRFLSWVLPEPKNS